MTDSCLSHIAGACDGTTRDCVHQVESAPAVPHRCCKQNGCPEQYTQQSQAEARAERAEATLTAVRKAVAQWRDWNPREMSWAIRDIERALSGEPDTQPQDPAAVTDHVSREWAN